ncbi:MAG: hypothetical protein H9535_02400 [Ignavibacteria bacterium]|nr:hypothetical protein [Ignavibacteria bacterium]
MPCKICIKQHDITDCGAACLATVAWYYDLKMPISRIRQYPKTDRKGTNVLGMVQPAQKRLRKSAWRLCTSVLNACVRNLRMCGR